MLPMLVSVKALILPNSLQRSQYHAVITQVILEVIEVIGRRTAEGDIPSIYQYLFQHSVLIYHISAIVCRQI